MDKNPVIGIIGGKGRMGKLFADFFVEKGLTVLISDLGTQLNNRQVAEKADIVIVSVPIDHAEKVIKEALPYIRKGSALMDFTSVKENTVKAMLKARCEVLGVHPMFGNSNPIPGQTVILCPTKKSGKWSQWLEIFLIKNKVKILKMSARQHDKMMNIAQGLIHFAEIAFADSLRRTKIPVQEILKYTGKASELKVQLAARIIDQDARLYANIQIENPQALKSLKLFRNSVDEFYKAVVKKDFKKFQKLFAENKKYLGTYTKEAYADSTFLIEKLIELQVGRKATKPKLLSPTKNSVAILGPENTYSDIIATKYLRENNLKNPKYFTRDIEEVFEFVEQKKVWQGIVPIENKLHGSIRETLDGLFAKKVHISSELNLAIHHSLIAHPQAGKFDIKLIISHSQALNQCRNYLKKHFPKAEKKSTNSTGAAIQELISSRDKHIAVIAPLMAAEKNTLQILAKNIEDSNENITTFILIKSGDFDSKKVSPNAKKTSIAFYFDKDSPGSLFTVFQEFANAKINLTKIESRPTKKQFGDYIFYLDFDGNLNEPKIKKTLESVSKKVAKLKILGSF